MSNFTYAVLIMSLVVGMGYIFMAISLQRANRSFGRAVVAAVISLIFAFTLNLYPNMLHDFMTWVG